MEIKEVIGIDVSKLTLDAHIYVKGFAQRFANTDAGIGEMLAWAKGSCGPGMANVLFVFEHTGLYSDILEGFLDSSKRPIVSFPASRSSAPWASPGERTTGPMQSG